MGVEDGRIMERDYKKEYEWQYRKYDEIRANIDKKLGMELREKLKKENKTVAEWVNENAKIYLAKEMIK